MVKIYLEDENKTKEIGYKLGNLLTPGSVICLIGDLGSGKTTMTQSLAKALEVDDYITSPTFTIVNEYEGKMPLYHFDVYRLSEAEEIYEVGYEDYLNSGGIILIEWADIIKSELPKEYIEIKLFYHEDETREVELRYVGNPAKEKEMLKYVDFSN